MEFMEKLFFMGFIILAAATDRARADTIVSGIVFCDQCKDGQVSFFDYPLSGMKVTIWCANSDGQVTMSREETTNWLGGYVMKFDDVPDLGGCLAQVSGGGQGSGGCGAAAGPAQNLRLMFRMFNMEIYAVDALLAQPAQPMSFCPRSSPEPAPVTPAIRSPPSFRLPPMPGLPPLPPLPPLPQLPPLPPLPPMPPFPFLEASACPHESWTMPEYKCHWRAVNPDTKVAVVFGLLAARRYGTDVTLWQGLQGRGEAYRTLLREGVTAFLNSYHSPQFHYNALEVVRRMNWALMGSPRGVLLTALRFSRANSGSGNVTTCKFTPCK